MHLITERHFEVVKEEAAQSHIRSNAIKVDALTDNAPHTHIDTYAEVYMHNV